jgi:hypothetical protein
MIAKHAHLGKLERECIVHRTYTVLYGHLYSIFPREARKNRTPTEIKVPLAATSPGRSASANAPEYGSIDAVSPASCVAHRQPTGCALTLPFTLMLMLLRYNLDSKFKNLGGSHGSFFN